MITLIRRILTGPSAEELASRELAQARRAVLEAQTAEEFARSQVRYNAAIKAALAQEQAEPVQANCALAELREKVGLAYGYLWCVNNEPGAPHQMPPERMAYEARKLLRDTMTHHERGEFINRVLPLVRGVGAELAQEQAEPVQEPWEHLKRYGYAPGNYMSKCRRCGAVPIMDKRAITCRACAEALHAESQKTEPVQEPITRLFGTLPVHDAPPKLVPLTEEEIALIDWESLKTKLDCVRAVERALEEKNRGR